MYYLFHRNFINIFIYFSAEREKPKLHTHSSGDTHFTRILVARGKNITIMEVEAVPAAKPVFLLCNVRCRITVHHQLIAVRTNAVGMYGSPPGLTGGVVKQPQPLRGKA